MTIITDVKPIDFKDKAAIEKKIDDFAKKYAYADVEYALIISPNGNAYSLAGNEREVNSLIIGKNVLKGSIGVHNHVLNRPEYIAKKRADSFSLKDLKFANENELEKQYLVSGTRRDAFELVEYHIVGIETAWDNAKYKMWEIHKENDTFVIFEQEDILRELKYYLKGFEYYENV